MKTFTAFYWYKFNGETETIVASQPYLEVEKIISANYRRKIIEDSDSGESGSAQIDIVEDQSGRIIKTLQLV